MNKRLELQVALCRVVYALENDSGFKTFDINIPVSKENSTSHGILISESAVYPVEVTVGEFIGGRDGMDRVGIRFCLQSQIRIPNDQRGLFEDTIFRALPFSESGRIFWPNRIPGTWELDDRFVLPEGYRPGETKTDNDEAFTALLKFVVDLVDLMDAIMGVANQTMVFPKCSADG